MADDRTDDPPAEVPAWRKRRMVRGRWVDPDDVKPASERVTRNVNVRVTESELAALDAQCAAVGLKRNRLLRIVIRKIGGYFEEDSQIADELRTIARQIKGVSTNINQIARALNQSGHFRLDDFMEERQRLGKELARADALMQTVLEYSERRSDGLKRIEELIGAKRSRQ